MPEREMVTKEVRHGNAPARNFVYDMKSAGISATFYADKFMRERSYLNYGKSLLCQHHLHLTQTITITMLLT